jgi:TRAP-type C4-dicarboxylate transport system substrate-binding protein
MRRRSPGRTVEEMNMRQRPKARFTGRTRLLVLLAALPLVGSGCFGGAGKVGAAQAKHTIVLTMASELKGQPAQLVRFAGAVQRLSGGTMRIQFKGNWRAGDLRQERDTIADVRAGRVDLAWVGARAWDWVGVRSFDALVAPFLVDSYPLERRVFERGIPQRMVRDVSRAGVVGIGVLPGPLRRVLAVRRALLEPVDFRGTTIGVQGVVAAQTLRSLGSREQQYFAQPELTGLDGIEEQLSAIEGNGHASTAKYLSANLSLWPRPLVIFAGRRRFQSLKPEQQATLRKAAAAAIPAAMSASRREDVLSASVLCRRGLRFVDGTPKQLAAMRLAVAPVYRRLERVPTTRRWIAAIEALKRVTPAGQAIRCANKTTRSGSKGTSPIDGVWEMRIGRDDLIGNAAYKLLGDASPHPTADDLRLDVGVYRLVLHGGRVSSSHHSSAEDVSATGDYTLHGGRIEITLSKGNSAGETWVYRWSLYRDRLTMRGVPGVFSPPNPAFIPWRRVGP